MRERASRGKRGQDQGFPEMAGDYFHEGPSTESRYRGSQSPSSSGQGWSARPTRVPAVATKLAASAEVKWFNAEKGYGFAALTDGSDVFVHIEAVTRAGLESLSAGDRIVVDVGPSDRGEKVLVLHSVEPGIPSATTTRPAQGGFSSPSRQQAPAAVIGQISGVVKFFDAIRGFGFVAPDTSGADVFVHASALQRAGISLERMVPGARLSGQVVMGRNGKPELGGSGITLI